MATATRPSLRDRMADGYDAAAMFALERWADAATEVERYSVDVREHGLSAAYGRAVLLREFWHGEAERCQWRAEALRA